MFTWLDHGLDKLSYNMDSCPVPAMHDDVTLAFVFGELLCIAVFDVSFANSRYFWGKSLLIRVLDVNGMFLFDH